MFIDTLKSKKKELFFITLLLIFFYRSPYIFLNGRFMAEEGEIFFANAYKYSFLYSFFFVDLYSGYLNLWANISGIISNFFDLEIAPLISNYLSLIPKLLIIYFVLYENLIALNNFWNKILFCLIVFICPQNVPEIWMNSINSQIFFCILSFVLLIINYQHDKIKLLNLGLLLISGLSGIYSCILTPVFFYKYYLFKKSQDFFNFLIILLCSITQVIIIFYSKFTGSLYAGKIHFINLELINNFIYNVFLKSFFGGNLIKYFYFNLETYFYVIILSSFLLFSFFIFFLLSFINDFKSFSAKSKFFSISLIYCFLSVSIIVMVGGVSNYVGGRYAALPSFYMLLLVLLSISILRNNLMRFCLIILLITSNVVGLSEFRPNVLQINKNHHSLKSLDCIGCPNWEEEVKKFRADNNYELKIWPYNNKSMNLN